VIGLGCLNPGTTTSQGPNTSRFCLQAARGRRPAQLTPNRYFSSKLTDILATLSCYLSATYLSSVHETAEKMLSILRKARLKDKELRILMLCAFMSLSPTVVVLLLSGNAVASTMRAKPQLSRG
jgi:hypothetical protein